MKEIEISGCKRVQLIKLMTKHLLEMDYEFTLCHDEEISRFDLEAYGSVLVATNAYDLEAKVKRHDN